MKFFWNLTFAGDVNGVLGPGLVGCATDHNVPAKDAASVRLKPFPIFCAPVAGEEFGFVTFSAAKNISPYLTSISCCVSLLPPI